MKPFSLLRDIGLNYLLFEYINNHSTYLTSFPNPMQWYGAETFFETHWLSFKSCVGFIKSSYLVDESRLERLSLRGWSTANWGYRFPTHPNNLTLHNGVCQSLKVLLALLKLFRYYVVNKYKNAPKLSDTFVAL